MGWFSILPDSLSTIETWVARVFLVLGLITIGPWAALLIYDALYYIWRLITYELPFVGGKARGRPRPRAPSLTERPSGHRRKISLPGTRLVSSGSDIPGSEHREKVASTKGRSMQDVVQEGE